MYGLGLANDPLMQPARAEAMAAAARNADLEDRSVRYAGGPAGQDRDRPFAFARDYLLRRVVPHVVTPHPLVERDDEIDAARERRARLRHRVARGDEVVVGIAGDLNASKGIEALLAAFPRVRSNVRGVLVGRTSSHWDVQGAVRGSGAREIPPGVERREHAWREAGAQHIIDADEEWFSGERRRAAVRAVAP
jgi:hypothetical protein